MNDKNKYEVLETMEWRNKTYNPKDIIEDTHNSYIRAMIHQGKLRQID